MIKEQKVQQTAFKTLTFDWNATYLGKKERQLVIRVVCIVRAHFSIFCSERYNRTVDLIMVCTRVVRRRGKKASKNYNFALALLCASASTYISSITERYFFAV
jgi:hypothetical protein